MNQREQQKKATMQRILTTAQTLFMTHGYAAVTTRMIADAADVQQPLLYHYFKTKEWLLKNSIIQAVKLIYALLRYNKSIGISCFPAFSLHFLGSYSEVIVWSIVTARFNCHLNPLVPV